MPPDVAEIARILARHPIFAKFTEESLIAVAAQVGFARFPAGATILRQGSRDTFAYVILEGEVDVFVEIPAGRIHLATVGSPRIIGELGALTDMPRTATVVAKTPTRLLRIERDSLMRLTAQYPAIGVEIVDELGHRLHDMNRALALLTYAATALGRDEFDPAMIEELTNQPGALAAFARVFADMAAEIRAKHARRQEMQAAAAIQRSILPGPPSREGAMRTVDLHAEMRPAREIGGDFYDYFPAGDRRLAVTVADVSGKGIPAALFMAVARTVLRNVEGGGDMAARMAAANRLLSAENAACMFVTAFHGVLELATGLLRYCNAGHNPPYLLRAGGARDTLKATGIPFGVDGGLPYRIGETVLAPGDALFLFSDGITEAFDPAGEEFGNARLEAALEAARGADAGTIVARILAAVHAFAGGAEQSDDITAMALVYRG